MNISQILNTINCTGCSACYNACPSDAINMELSTEGFYAPIVNNTICTNCGICTKVCPVLNIPHESIKEDHFLEPETYVSWSLDNEIRINSSSGGIYPELAKHIINNNGIVYAVGWNANWLPEHKEITTISDIEKTIGSKYVQSYVGHSFNHAIQMLKNGKLILFIGTPCQIAGLKQLIKYLKLDSSKLILVDLICHGVPSPLVFKKYLNTKFSNKIVSNIYFRKKVKGWGPNLYLVVMLKGRTYKKHCFKDSYYWAFLSDLYLNKSCYNCHFAKIPRQGDITLGDFWGVPNNYYDKRGVSVVLINSKKGKDIFSLLQSNNFVFAEKVDFNLATVKNPRIINGIMKIPSEREKILGMLDKKPWYYIEKKYIILPYSIKGFIKRSRKFINRILFKVRKG